MKTDMVPHVAPLVKRISGSKNFRSTPQKRLFAKKSAQSRTSPAAAADVRSQGGIVVAKLQKWLSAIFSAKKSNEANNR